MDYGLRIMDYGLRIMVSHQASKCHAVHNSLAAAYRSKCTVMNSRFAGIPESAFLLSSPLLSFGFLVGGSDLPAYLGHDGDDVLSVYPTFISCMFTRVVYSWLRFLTRSLTLGGR